MEAVSSREAVPAPAAPAGDQPAASLDFDGFYTREFPAMSALAHTVCGDRASAEDIAQEALSRAHQHWPKISRYDRPGAWLRRVTINLALSRRDRGRREVVGMAPFERAGSQVADRPGTDADTDVWDAVALLAPRQRAVVALFYQDDLATDAIAEILDCSVSTVTSHLAAARKRLAELLGEETNGSAAAAPPTPTTYPVVTVASKANR
jgi:RNA polymerase sigma-70 factor (ECF subfamily)